MAHLLIVRGLPGSGKSTLAGKLERKHFEADMWMVDEDGHYKFDPEQLSRCHEACLTSVHNALLQGYDVVVSNTFTRRWEVLPYINLGFDYSIVVAEGCWPNVHGVPQEIIRGMLERWEWF